MSTAVTFSAVAAAVGANPALPALLVLAAALLAVSAVDVELRRIPTRIVYPALGLIAAYLIGVTVLTGEWPRLMSALVGLLVGRLPLWLANFLYPRGMGFGDVRLATLIGFTLGWLSLGHVVVALFAAFALASIVGATLIVAFGRSRTDQIPFGPFLAAGAVGAVVIGDEIVGWYSRLS